MGMLGRGGLAQPLRYRRRIRKRGGRCRPVLREGPAGRSVGVVRLFEDGEFKGDADRLVWMTEEENCLGSFEAGGTAEKGFSEYGELFRLYGDDPPMHRAFGLPHDARRRAFDLWIPNYGLTILPSCRRNHESAYEPRRPCLR